DPATAASGTGDHGLPLRTRAERVFAPARQDRGGPQSHSDQRRGGRETGVLAFCFTSSCLRGEAIGLAASSRTTAQIRISNRHSAVIAAFGEGGRSSNPCRALCAYEGRQVLLDAPPEPVIGRRFTPTRWRGMTSEKTRARVLATDSARALHHRYPPQEQRAQGRPGGRCTRGPRAKNICAGAKTTGTGGNHTGLPCAMVLRLIGALPGEPALATVVDHDA